MKTFNSILLTLSFLFIGTSFSFAGESSKTFVGFYKKYKQVDESFAMNLPTVFFRWALEEEERELTEGIKNIQILIVEDIGSSQQSLTLDIKNYFPKNIYHDLMIVQDGRDRITLKFREREKNNNELIVLIRDENSLFSICLTGNVTEENAKKIMQSIDLNKLKDDLSED